MIRSIPDIRVKDPETRKALEAMAEIIDVLLGRRGKNTNDRVIRYINVKITESADAEEVTAVTAAAGADTIDMAALNTSLATLAAEINAIVDVVNDLRFRLIP